MLYVICRWEKVIVTENNKGRIFYLDCNFFPMLSSIIRGKPPIITLKQAFKSECNFQLYLPKLWEADSPVIISVNCADHLINLHFKQILRKTLKTTFLPPPFLKLPLADCREQTLIPLQENLDLLAENGTIFKTAQNTFNKTLLL